MAYDLVARLRIKDEGFERTMKRAANAASMLEKTVGQSNNAIDRMTRAAGSAGGAFSRMGAAAGASIDTIRRSAVSAATSIGGITTAIAGAAASFAAYKGTSHALKLASDAEQAGIAFETMLGSAEKAQKFIAELTDFAAKTPFDLPQLRNSSRRLLAFGFGLERVLPMLTAVGNAAAGLGLGSEGVDRITLALGQMQAKSKVSGDEMLQLTEAGIPAWQILADKMRISTAEVMKMSEKGLIPANKAINVLIDGMNKRFPNMMEKQSKSLQGLYNAMKETFENKLLVRWGQGIAAALKPRFDQIVRWIDANGATIDRWGRNIAKAAQTGADGILRGFEGAFTYIRDRFINNPDFMNLNTKGRVDFIFTDIKKTFDSWYNRGGNEQIRSATESLIGFISDALSGSSEKLTKIGADLGKSMGSGMVKGLQEFAKENPTLSALLAFIATPGPLAAKAAAAMAVGGQGVTNMVIGTPTTAEERAAKGITNPFYREGGLKLPGADAFFEMSDKLKSAVDSVTPSYEEFRDKVRGYSGKHYSGLDRVPYDGYRAILHKDERVQTKSEADNYRSGRGSLSGVMITGNTFNVRQESDIDAIARALAKELEALAQ